jgi:hypothetical protein
VAFFGPMPATMGETNRLSRVACQDMTRRTIASVSVAMPAPLASAISSKSLVISKRSIGG